MTQEAKYMTPEDVLRGEVIALVVEGKMTQTEASKRLCRTTRQIKRLCARFREEGAEGLVHRSRGRPSRNKISEERCQHILDLIKKHYINYGPQGIKNKLSKKHDIHLSREFIRILMIKEGLWTPRIRPKETEDE